jgi:hypothetical protein
MFSGFTTEIEMDFPPLLSQDGHKLSSMDFPFSAGGDQQRVRLTAELPKCRQPVPFS